GDAGGTGHRPPTPRIHAPGALDAPQGAGSDPHDAARIRLGPQLRSANQRRGNPYQPAPRQGGQALRARVDPHRPRRRLQDRGLTLVPRVFRVMSRSAGSTPVRQAMGLVVVFAVVNLVTLGFAYLSLRSSAEEAMRSNLVQLMAGFDAAASPGAAEVMVTAAAEAADPAHRVFAYIAPDGRVTGNADARLTADGVEIRPMPEGRPLGRDGYLPLIDRKAGGVLIIGESLTPIRELGRTFLGLLALSLVPTVLISLGLGAALAARARARVERIEQALGRLSEGALDTRIPAEPGRADDLARIGARINRMAEAQEAATEALKQVSA